MLIPRLRSQSLSDIVPLCDTILRRHSVTKIRVAMADAVAVCVHIPRRLFRMAERSESVDPFRPCRILLSPPRFHRDSRLHVESQCTHSIKHQLEKEETG